MKKSAAALLLVLAPLIARAQQEDTSAPTPPEQSIHQNTLTSLTGEFFRGDFFNIYAFANGDYDSTQQTVQSPNVSGGGYTVGGGITASKRFSSGLLSLSYRGDYRNYSAGFNDSGTDQYLSLLYSRRLGRRWSISFSETAGILFYSNAFYPTLGPSGSNVNTNPFSPSTRFLESGVYLTYRQTRRLSYTISGDFFLNRYSYPGSIGSTGGIFSVSASYAISPRTSFGGTYSHDNFVFQHSAGTTVLDGGFGNISHTFGRNWRAYFSAGITHAHTYGIIQIPVTAIFGGQTVTGYLTGPYNTVSNVPTLDGGVTHHMRAFDLSVSTGRGVNPGNGTYLTSSDTFFTGLVSRKLDSKSVISANLSYMRIVSIANQVSEAFSQTFFTVYYSRVLYPHIAGYFGYTYNRYSALLNYGSSSNNQIVVGVAFTSKSIPLTIF